MAAVTFARARTTAQQVHIKKGSEGWAQKLAGPLAEYQKRGERWNREKDGGEGGLRRGMGQKDFLVRGVTGGII